LQFRNYDKLLDLEGIFSESFKYLVVFQQKLGDTRLTLLRFSVYSKRKQGSLEAAFFSGFQLGQRHFDYMDMAWLRQFNATILVIAIHRKWMVS